MPASALGEMIMKAADPKRRHRYIYQMRSGWGEDPNEILTRLTHQVWQTFDKRQQRRSENTLDPHLWPEIFHTFRRAFRDRLTYHPLCGRQGECLTVPCVLCGGQPHTHPSLSKVYLLETHRPLTQFLKAVASAVARRLRLKGVRSEPEEKPVRRFLQESMVDALKQNFFMTEICQSCPVRVGEGGGDRRIWARDVLDSPWGGVRDILPEDLPLVGEIEEV